MSKNNPNIPNHGSQRSFSIRSVVYMLLSACFFYIIWRHFVDAKSLWHNLRQGSLGLIVFAIFLQTAYWLLFTDSYRQTFRLAGIRRAFKELLPLTLAAQFINMIVPAATTSGMAFFVDDAVRRGHSSIKAASATLLQLILDLTAILFFACAGLIILLATRHLEFYEIIGAVILVVLIGILLGLLVFGAKRPGLIQAVLNSVKKIINRCLSFFTRKDAEIIALDSVSAYTKEITEASRVLADNRAAAAGPLFTLCASYILHALTIMALFAAFRTPVPIEAVLAGLSMGLLFWIVTPIPGGVGAVEGVMIAVFTAFGVPLAPATIVVFAFRGLAFWLPLLIGFAMVRYTKAFHARNISNSDKRDVRVAAFFVFLMGLINIVSALIPPAFHAGRRVFDLVAYSPLLYHYGGHLTAVVSGFTLIVLSAGLWRRKRVAYLLTISVLIISGAGHVLKGFDYGGVIAGTVLAAWLWHHRKSFFALSDTPSIYQGLRAAAISAAFILVYGVLGFYILDNNFNVNYNFIDSLWQTIVLFTRFYDPAVLPVPITYFGAYFVDSINIVSIAAFAYSLFMLLRPVLARQIAVSSRDFKRAEALIRKYGKTELAPMALFDDKRYFFSNDEVVIAYAAHHRAAVALGDPIGNPRYIPAAIKEYKAFCEKNDWIPAFYQARAKYLNEYARIGFKTLKTGHKGTVDLREFSLEGRSNKSLRSSYNKLIRNGFHAEVLEPPHTGTLLRQLKNISDEWLENMHGSEKKFSIGWFNEKILQRGAIIVVYDANNKPLAFANIVHIPAAQEISIDLMRYKSNIYGIMDFLFVSLLTWARESGFHFFGLGSSPLSGIGERKDDPRTERFLHFAYKHLNRIYNFKGLHLFKSKFHPAWSPRYLVYPSPITLTQIALSLNTAINVASLSMKALILEVMHNLKRFSKKVPFTLLFLLILVVTAYITGTHSAALSQWWMQRLGFAPIDFAALEWWRAISSVFVTNGGAVFWHGIALVIVIVGYAEWRFGTAKTSIVFFCSHFLTLLLISIIALYLHSLGNMQDVLIAHSRDVGPSAGYFGVLGMALSLTFSGSKAWRAILFFGITIVLLGVLLFTPMNDGGVAKNASWAHLISFPLGWIMTYFFMKPLNNRVLCEKNKIHP